MKAPNYADCTNHFCSSLSEPMRADLCANKLTIRCKKKHSFIFDEGQIAIVRSGIIIPSFIREDGKEKGLSLKVPGTLLGLSQLFNKKGRLFNIYALDDFEACVCSASYFETKFEENLDFAKELMRSLSHTLTFFSEFNEELTLGNSIEKVYALFHLIDSDSVYKGLNLTHDEMAMLFGINRVTVTKAITAAIRKNEDLYGNHVNHGKFHGGHDDNGN